ncbi:permease-like cell division protein FtsX [Glaciecola petra]|uniref:Cell division protein FtsX n=1 Tax=Glaciecola petra TaxID=3075602 RepID=A0ABU2ZS53_9ALTE|nr:permease-like cell division protein FtsX [Aestuariibacter sp. P117]MDT0595450.1 permease-like cell division protein FtsX [Aestuariibacter sp. P117]
MSLLFSGRKQASSGHKIGFFQRIIMFFADHLRQCVNSVGDLYRTPFASLMTIGVLGFSITLPSTLYIMVENTEQITEQWQQASEISLFLRDGLSEPEAQQLLKRLQSWDEISSVTYVSSKEALEEFQRLSGLGEALDYLDRNPLPAVMMVVPTSKHASPTAAGVLLDKLRKEREVDIGKLDIEWLERLYSLLAIAKELVYLLGGLLLFAVVLIIGNTIRLNILNKRDEILVMKLVGATDAFIQRPFLYTGFWYGLLGGLMAWVTVTLILLWIGWSLDSFLQQYQLDLNITGMNISALFVMLFVSIALGLVGSFISVQKHVSEIEPS